MVRLMGKTPCLFDMVSKGVTPVLSICEAQSLGYRIIIYPILGLGGAIKGITQALTVLKTNKREPEDLIGIKEAFSLCGLNGCIKLDQKRAVRRSRHINETYG